MAIQGQMLLNFIFKFWCYRYRLLCSHTRNWNRLPGLIMYLIPFRTISRTDEWSSDTLVKRKQHGRKISHVSTDLCFQPSPSSQQIPNVIHNLILPWQNKRQDYNILHLPIYTCLYQRTTRRKNCCIDNIFLQMFSSVNC